MLGVGLDDSRFVNSSYLVTVMLGLHLLLDDDSGMDCHHDVDLPLVLPHMEVMGSPLSVIGGVLAAGWVLLMDSGTPWRPRLRVRQVRPILGQLLEGGRRWENIAHKDDTAFPNRGLAKEQRTW